MEYKVDFLFLFSCPKLVATTTNLFINGSSLHGSHQVIILAARNSDGPVTGLSYFESKIVVLH